MAEEEISSRSVRQKRGCEEMRIHFFTAPFCALRKGGFIAEYNRKGDIGSRRLSRNVISSEVEKSSLPCGYPCQCENENRRLCVSFSCRITSAVMGLPERSLGCARDDETGSGWFLTRFQISAIHPLPSVCPSLTSSQRGGMPEELRRAFFSYRQPSPRGEGCDTRIPSSKKRRRSRYLNPEP